jgi:archaellum biogenesis protein FlaJ (TadC family)
MAVILVVMRQSRDSYASAVDAVKQWKGIYDSVSIAASCVADNICQTIS